MTYKIITTISQHVVKYVVPESWDDEAVVRHINEGTIEDFSQRWLGSTTIETKLVDETELLSTFDKENAYLAGWTSDQKKKWVERLYEDS